MFGLGAVVLSSVPSGAVASTTLYADNVNGTVTTGCNASGTGACKTIQEGVNAAEPLNGTAVTLDVPGSSTDYVETVTINLPSASGDSLVVQGTGATLPTLNDGGVDSNVTLAPTSAGAVTIDSMTISGGTATSGTQPAGGGIHDSGTGTLTVSNDTFSNNTNPNDNGGAIDAVDGCALGTTGNVVVTRSTFVGNSAPNGDGGAIDAHDCDGTGTLTVTDRTFVSNTAPWGAGVGSWTDGSSVTNSTFASNSASSDGSALQGDSLQMVDDTLTANTGDAIQSNTGFSVADSLLDDAPAGADCAGPITDGGYNVSSDASCTSFGATSLKSSTTIGTLALAANGSSGPQTAAITTSSSAHGIVPVAAYTVSTDERGKPRPGVGFTACDAGAYEIQKGTGYDLAGSHGGVFVFPVGQPSGFYGSLPGLGVKVNDIVAMVAEPGGGGYLLVGRDGGVFTFGSAHFYGSLPGKGITVNNIVAIASTPTGLGYYLVGSDGTVYPFGDATDHGSLPAMHIAVSDIVGIVPTADGGGYWLIGADGGGFAMGNATFIGSLPGLGIRVSNIVGAVPTSS